SQSPHGRRAGLVAYVPSASPSCRARPSSAAASRNRSNRSRSSASSAFSCSNSARVTGCSCSVILRAPIVLTKPVLTVQAFPGCVTLVAVYTTPTHDVRDIGETLGRRVAPDDGHHACALAAGARGRWLV